MKRKTFIIGLVLLYCDCFAITLFTINNQPVPLYDDNDKIVEYIQNDSIKEDYLHIYPDTNQHDSLYRDKIYIKTKYVFKDGTTKGWVRKSDLRVIIHCCTHTLCLYSEPSYNGNKIGCLERYNYNTVQILQIKGEWLYVKFQDWNDVTYEGWLSPEDQCYDPYSLCCGC